MESTVKLREIQRERKHLRPGQTIATFQRNILQHCCMMLRQVMIGLAKRNILNIFNATCQCLCASGPWRATSGPSTHALVQQCELGQTSTTSCDIQNISPKI